jgi:hypothetical protein
MFSLRNPEWLSLLPALALAGWYWPQLKLLRPLRFLTLLVAVGILCRPQWFRQIQGMDLMVLLDRSASTEDKVSKNLREWQGLLEKHKRSDADNLVLIDYATDVLPQSTGGNQPFTGSNALTRTNFAIQNALAMKREDRPTRLLLFTDGYSTEPMTGLSEKLLRENVPLDVRFLQEQKKDDFQITRFRLPIRVPAGEPFLIEVEATGPADKLDVPLQIVRDGQLLQKSKVSFKNNRGFLRFTDRLLQAGSRKYEVMLLPAEGTDAHFGNNRAESWIEVQSGPRVLLVTGYQDDPLVQSLKGQGYEVEVASDPKALTVGQLSNCKAVVLNNVPAYELPGDFMRSLPFFVREQGGGLLMAGGKKSFGSGGYFRSAIDPLLPVSMELKTDQRKTAVTLALVLDRSGSMGAGVAGGRTKMDLANDGAAEAVKLLGNQDWVTVLAVDSAVHKAVGLQQIADAGNQEDIQELCRRIQVGGGGIFTYTGLQAAWDAIKDTKTGVRHIILFADAADAEEPGSYQNLLDEVTRDGGTVSVIAMGTPADVDAKFLEDVAKRGKGSCNFAELPEEIPKIFMQETVAIARSAFVTDLTGAAPTGGWLELTQKNLAWLPKVDSYNLSYKQNWASQALITQDEYAAPLVAWGQRGAGRTAAISFPLGGPNSAGIRAWDKYGDFVQTMSRWLMGEPMPPGLGLRHELRGTELELNLLFDDTWTETFDAQAPRIVVAQGNSAEFQQELTWEKLNPGHFQVRQDLSEGQVARGVIQAGKYALPFGPLAVGSGIEWAFAPERIEELLQVSSASGGRELLDLSQAWLSPMVKNWKDLRLPLLIALLLLILADALITRMGWKLPEFAWKRAPAPKTAKTAAKPSPAPVASLSAKPEKIESPQERPVAGAKTEAVAENGGDDAVERRSRFARAKKNFDG